MLQFKQDSTSEELVLTLTEKVSINDAFFLFVFTHVLTKNQVKFIKDSADDESDFPSRYNLFTINPSVVFLNQPIGEWHYKIYEQASSSNTTESASGEILEYGKLKLDRATAFSFTKYNEPTTFKTYN